MRRLPQGAKQNQTSVERPRVTVDALLRGREETQTCLGVPRLCGLNNGSRYGYLERPPTSCA